MVFKYWRWRLFLLFSQHIRFSDVISLPHTTFTLEPTITDLKLIRICFKTSSNSTYPLPTVYTRLWKRSNDNEFTLVCDNDECTVIYDMLKMLQGCLKFLENYIFNCLHYKIISHSKLKTKTVKNHYGNFYVFLFIRFRSKSALISKIVKRTKSSQPKVPWRFAIMKNFMKLAVWDSFFTSEALIFT